MKTRLLAITAAAFVCSASVQAHEPQIRTAIKAQQTAAAAEPAKPVTGRKPNPIAAQPATQAEIQAMAQQMRDRFLRDGYDYPVRSTPDGGSEKRTGYRNLNFRMARIKAEGELETVCVDGADQAIRYVEQSGAKSATGKAVQK